MFNLAVTLMKGHAASSLETVKHYVCDHVRYSGDLELDCKASTAFVIQKLHGPLQYASLVTVVT